MRRLNFAAALVALPSASGFVETWRAYDQAPYSYTWQLPVYANDTAGLGAGITYAIHPTFCDRLLDRFSEKSEIFAAFDFVSCTLLKSAISRAFQSWSNNHPHITFADRSSTCEALNYTEPSECPGVEIVIDVTAEEDATNSTTNERAAHIEYALEWDEPRRPSGAVHGRAAMIKGASIKFSAKPGMCWYLDSTFCAGFHMAESLDEGEGSPVLLAGRVVFGFLWVAAMLAVVCTIGLGIRRQVRTMIETAKERKKRKRAAKELELSTTNTSFDPSGDGDIKTIGMSVKEMHDRQ